MCQISTSTGTVEKTLYSLFRRSAAQKGANIFFSDENENCSGNESLELVARLAGSLQALGVKKGDRVVFICGSSVRHILLYFACQHIAAIPCALHLRNTGAAISSTLNWLNASLLVIDGYYRQLALDGLGRAGLSVPLVMLDEDKLDAGESGYRDLLGQSGTGIKAVAQDADAAAMIILSSGTTGEPKGIVHSQRTLYESAMAGARVFGAISEEDSVLVFMSPSFAAWNHVVLSYLACSARIVFNHVFNTDLFLQTLARERITSTAMVPTAWRRVLQGINRDTDLSALKLAFFSGEPGSPEFIEMMQQRLPQCEIRTAYLTSEGSVASACVADEKVLAKNIASVGKPIAGAEVRVVNVDGDIDEAVDQGETGEILQRGKSLALAYWGNEALSEQKFIRGWWRTGDLGRLDEYGYLTIVGRADNMIISGGLKVHAEEVELALMQHPAVALAAVVGKADPEWGQRIEAYVVVNAEVSAEDILQYCRDQQLLCAFKLPKRINFRDSLPTGATGKIYRRGLLEE